MNQKSMDVLWRFLNFFHLIISSFKPYFAWNNSFLLELLHWHAVSPFLSPHKDTHKYQDDDEGQADDEKPSQAGVAAPCGDHQPWVTVIQGSMAGFLAIYQTFGSIASSFLYRVGKEVVLRPWLRKACSNKQKKKNQSAKNHPMQNIILYLLSLHLSTWKRKVCLGLLNSLHVIEHSCFH